jgi:hypothetical protein
MKRPVVTAVFLLAVAGLAGCPIYDHQDAGCFRSSDCARGYLCDQYNGDCVPATDTSYCAQPADCDVTSTCTPAGLCEFGDCSFRGCVAGYQCDSSSGVWACVPNGTIPDAGSNEAGASAGGSAGQGGQSVGTAGAPDVSTGGVAGGD